MSLYTEALEKGLVVGNHESDLYLKYTQDAVRLIRSQEFHWNASTFRDQVTGNLTIEVPFAYDPFWETRSR